MSSNETGRLIMLGDYVTSSSVQGLIKSIIQFNMQDDSMSSALKNYRRKPIVLIVNSFGGSAYDAFGLIDAIQMSATPVITVCLGSAMSAGFAIFVAGKVRLVGKNSTFMYHEAANHNAGKITDQRKNLEETDRVQRIYDSIILENTNILESQLKEVRDKSADWYISADEAIKLGVADQIVSDNMVWAYEDEIDTEEE